MYFYLSITSNTNVTMYFALIFLFVYEILVHLLYLQGKNEEIHFPNQY